MSIGPWFKCYPTDWLEGIRDLSLPAQGAYAHLIMRMYEAADAIYVDDKRIGKWLNSNARGWLKVKQELIDEGKLIELSDGGLINPRCLRQMAEECKSDRKIPDFICERIGKLSDMFAESFPKHSQMFPETSPKKPTKTKPPIRVQNTEPEGVEDKSSPPRWAVGEPDLPDKSACRQIFDATVGMVPPTANDFQALIQLTRPEAGEPCSLAKDILPTLTAICSKRKAESPNDPIRSYSYFREPCIRARDRRVSGVPPVKPVPASGYPGGHESTVDLARRLIAEEQQGRAGWGGRDEHGFDLDTIDVEPIPIASAKR